MDLYIVSIDDFYTLVIRANNTEDAQQKALKWVNDNAEFKDYEYIRIDKADCNEIIE